MQLNIQHLLNKLAKEQEPLNDAKTAQLIIELIRKKDGQKIQANLIKQLFENKKTNQSTDLDATLLDMSIFIFLSFLELVYQSYAQILNIHLEDVILEIKPKTNFLARNSKTNVLDNINITTTIKSNASPEQLKQLEALVHQQCHLVKQYIKPQNTTHHQPIIAPKP